MLKKLVILLIILIVVAFSNIVGICSENVIKIGTSSPRTGDHAITGKYTDEGTFMARDEINAAGGILGMQIEIIAEDDKGIPVEGVNAIRRLIYQDKVVAIIGPFQSAVTLSAMEISQEAKIPTLCMSLSPTITQQGNPYIFRIRPTDEVIMKYMGDFIVDELKAEKIGVLYDSGEWGTTGANIIIPKLEERGKPPIFTGKISTGDKDFSSQIIKLKESGVKVLLLQMYEPESGLFIKQARQLGLDSQIVGGNIIGNPRTVSIAGIDNIEGSITLTSFLPKDNRPKVKEFVKKFESAYGYTPDEHPAGVYDGVYILKEAIETAQSINPEDIIKALHNIKNFEGVLGFYSYDEHGDGLWKVSVGILKNGEIEPYYK